MAFDFSLALEFCRGWWLVPLATGAFGFWLLTVDMVVVGWWIVDT
jgi:hypothetical protein